MAYLKGRLGLDSARIPHVDRHGLLYMERGHVQVDFGTIRFVTAGFSDLAEGRYQIPHQTVSCLLLGPGTTISQDALRILSAHGTALVAVGTDGVRVYSAPPLLPDTSDIARRQVRSWADPETRLMIARKMYAIRFGEILPHKDIDVLRGIEASRVKEGYRALASRHGVRWEGRRYDRSNPSAADLPNQAINHAATAVEAAATVAVYAVGALPQLGYIHEASGASFILDVADILRLEQTVTIAFRAVRAYEKDTAHSLDWHVRSIASQQFRRHAVIPTLIDHIKRIFDVNDCGGSD